VNIALEFGHFGHKLGFGNQRFVASGLNDASLVESKRTKRTLAVAAAAADKGKANLIQSGNMLGVGRMGKACIRKIVNSIQLVA